MALTDSRPSASTWKVTRMWAAPAAMGGMPVRVKRARGGNPPPARAPLHHMDGHRGLAILEGGELLGRGPPEWWYCAGSPSQQGRPWSLTQESGMTSSSSISASGLLPTRMSAWMAAPMATTLSGVDAGQWRAAEELAHPLAHQRHPGRAADHHHFQYLFLLETRIAQGAPTGLQGAFDQGLDQLVKLAAGDGTCQPAKAQTTASASVRPCLMLAAASSNSRWVRASS